MLRVICKEDAQDVLANFPFRDGQYLESESHDSDNAEGYEFVVLDIEGFEDLNEMTVAQMQHLDTNDDVVSYYLV